MLNLLLLAAATSSPAPIDRPQWWTENLDSLSITSSDVMICKFEGEWRKTTLKVLQVSGFGGIDTAKAWPCYRGKGLEVTAKGFVERVIIVPELGPDMTPPRTGTFLAFGHKASKATEGGWIITADTGRQPLARVRLQGASEDEFCALLTLPVKESFTPPGAGLESRLESILRTVNPADYFTYVRVCRLLNAAHPPWTSKPNALDPILRYQFQPTPASRDTVDVCVNPSLSERFRRLESEALTEAQRSRLLELQVRWRLPGRLQPYLASLRKLLQDPDAYSGPEEVGATWGPVGGTRSDHVAIDGWVDCPIDEWISDLSKSKNLVLRRYFLRSAGGPMNLAQHGRFARLLKIEDRAFQYEVMTILASQTQSPDQAPKLYDMIDGKLVDYPDFQEKLRYWMKRFDIQ